MVIFTWTMGIALGLIVHLNVASHLVAPVWRTGASLVPYAIGAVWLAVAFLIPSPEAATNILNLWIEPVAGVYVIVELLLALVVRLFSRTKAAAGTRSSKSAGGRMRTPLH
jgi:hypothetical protein